MKTATFLSRPALEPLFPKLLKTFGEGIAQQDRVKQMIGHMVRQIMEHHGYRLEDPEKKDGVRVTSEGNMFSRAALYTL